MPCPRTGTSFVETYLYGAATRHTGAAKVVGDGAVIAPSPGKEIFAHRETGDALHAFVAPSRPLGRFGAVDFTDARAVTARIAREFGRIRFFARPAGRVQLYGS